MLNYCCLFHKYDVSLTPYCKTTLELVNTLNCLEMWSSSAGSTVFRDIVLLPLSLRNKTHCI